MRLWQIVRATFLRRKNLELSIDVNNNLENKEFLKYFL
jgi:hypothetical protein